MTYQTCLEILQTVVLHDQIVKEKLESNPRNAVYTLPGIQNGKQKHLGVQKSGVAKKNSHD